MNVSEATITICLSSSYDDVKKCHRGLGGQEASRYRRACQKMKTAVAVRRVKNMKFGKPEPEALVDLSSSLFEDCIDVSMLSVEEDRMTD